MLVSGNFNDFFAAGFGMARHEPDFYIEACEEVPEMLADDEDGDYHAFRDEFAGHIRESSFTPPTSGDTQWMTDEWLRDIWYDAFGPEPPPGDPFPVPSEDWGHRRLTDYMLHAINKSPEHSSAGAPVWLAARGLTFADISAGVGLSATQSVGFRSAPDGWFEHIKDVTRRGLRQPQPGEPISDVP